MSHKISVKAKLYAVADGATAPKAYANVSIGNLININSYVVSNTFGNPDKMTAFPPSRRDTKSGDYKPFIEFSHPKDNALVCAIKKACHSAYELYSSTGRLHEYGKAYTVDIDNLFGLAEKTSKNGENTDFGNTKKSITESGEEVLEELEKVGF